MEPFKRTKLVGNGERRNVGMGERGNGGTENGGTWECGNVRTGNG